MVQTFNHNKRHFKLYVDKNNSIYDITETIVISWKKIHGKNVPDEVKETRSEFFNMVKGNPVEIAIRYISELY